MINRILPSIVLLAWSSGALASDSTDKFALSAEAEAPVSEDARPEIRFLLQYNGEGPIILRLPSYLSNSAEVSGPGSWQRKERPKLRVVSQWFRVDPNVHLAKGEQLDDKMYLENYFSRIEPGVTTLHIQLNLNVSEGGRKTEARPQANVQFTITEKQARAFNDRFLPGPDRPTQSPSAEPRKTATK